MSNRPLVSDSLFSSMRPALVFRERIARPVDESDAETATSSLLEIAAFRKGPGIASLACVPISAAPHHPPVPQGPLPSAATKALGKISCNPSGDPRSLAGKPAGQPVIGRFRERALP